MRHTGFILFVSSACMFEAHLFVVKGALYHLGGQVVQRAAHRLAPAVGRVHLRRRTCSGFKVFTSMSFLC